MRTSNNGWWIAAGIGAVLVGGYLYNRNRKLVRENYELKEQQRHLKILIHTIKESSQFNNQMKQEILWLIDYFKNLDEKIANELAQALQLLQIGQTENAIEDLVKIMENILEQKYKSKKSFGEWLRNTKKKLNLHNMLEYAKKCEDIDEVEFKFFVAVKTIRNKEDHTLDLKLADYLNASGLITCIGAIMKLGQVNHVRLQTKWKEIKYTL